MNENYGCHFIGNKATWFPPNCGVDTKITTLIWKILIYSHSKAMSAILDSIMKITPLQISDVLKFSVTLFMLSHTTNNRCNILCCHFVKDCNAFWCNITCLVAIFERFDRLQVKTWLPGDYNLPSLNGILWSLKPWCSHQETITLGKFS